MITLNLHVVDLARDDMTTSTIHCNDYDTAHDVYLQHVAQHAPHHHTFDVEEDDSVTAYIIGNNII
jgi:hypothetical protein